jgi:hypothetical protein
MDPTEYVPPSLSPQYESRSIFQNVAFWRIPDDKQSPNAQQSRVDFPSRMVPVQTIVIWMSSSGTRNRIPLSTLYSASEKFLMRPLLFFQLPTQLSHFPFSNTEFTNHDAYLNVYATNFINYTICFGPNGSSSGVSIYTSSTYWIATWALYNRAETCSVINKVRCVDG